MIFLFTLLSFALIAAVLTGLYLLGWRFQRLLLPFFLLLIIYPFQTYAQELCFALEFATCSISIFAEPQVDAGSTLAAFAAASTWLFRAFYVTSLALLWFIPFLAPATPILLFVLFGEVALSEFGVPVGHAGGLWSSGLYSQDLFFTMLLMSLLLFSYTLPSLLKWLARRSWLPEPLSQDVLRERLSYREKLGVFKRVFTGKWR